MDDDTAPDETRMNRLARALRRAFGGAWQAGSRAAATALPRPALLVAGVAVAAAAWLAVKHLPVRTVPRGEVTLRDNRLTGGATEFAAGSVLVVPGLHELRVYDLRDHVYHPEQSARADGPAPFQSVEGLSLGVDLSVRYALDARRVSQTSRDLPQDIGADIVAPAVQGVIYRVFTHYTVREIFSSKRVEIQQALESELRTRLAADGVLLRSVQVGKVDLPADYKRGMESLLAEDSRARRCATRWSSRTSR